MNKLCTLTIIAVISVFLLAACQPQATSPRDTDTKEPVQEEEEEQGEFEIAGGGEIEFTEQPRGPLNSGDVYNFMWSATGGSHIITNVQASFSRDFSTLVGESPEVVNGPGVYAGKLDLDTNTERTVFIRARAVIDGNEIFTPSLTMNLLPGGAPSAPAEPEAPMEETGGTKPSEPAMPSVQEFEMEGNRWDFEPEILVVKKDVLVRITIHSNDVPHGIAIPAFGVNQRFDKDPVTFEFMPDKAGEFDFYCTVLCGSGHSGMRSTLIVED